jgi:nucleoside transporter
MLPVVKRIVSDETRKKTWVQNLGLEAFVLFRQKKMVLFFIFSMLLGGALQLTNAYGDSFLQDPNVFPKGGLINNFSTIILSISQISETLFILSIPFFLRYFGIKKVMLFSMIAWVLRFGLFGLADNTVTGFILIITSCIVYGMAFDFFNISGALFVEQNTDSKITASAQGVFMLMTNGIGAVLGNIIAGQAIRNWFEDPATLIKDWPGIWISFAGYAIVVAILFAILFRHKHEPEAVKDLRH